MEIQIIIITTFISLLTDLYRQKIYNAVLLVSFGALLLNYLYQQEWLVLLKAITAALALLAVLIIPFQKGQVGAGDAKLLSLIIFALGWRDGFSAVLIIFILGGIFASLTLFYQYCKYKDFIKSQKIPYGLAIFFGLILYLRIHSFTIF